ncbi:MAG: YARHG domain-containing protein [Clostridium sp.]
MKKIILLLTTIMIVSVLNGCNLSNNETKDVKNKEEISYSNDKNKKETDTISLELVDSSEEDNDYILPDSDKKYLSVEDIKNLSKEELAIARNEIFARHGYVFKMEEYKNYFKSKTWYKENPSFSGSESELNEYEKANINLIKSYESNKINVTEDGEINYFKYGNARFGFSIDYPDFLTESTESMNGDGVTLTNLENTVCLKAYGLNNVLSQTTKDYFESNKESIGVDISYEALFDNSYILSWEENNLIYYQYTVVGTGCFNAFCISYPKEEKEKFDEIVTTIYNNFETGDLTEIHGPIMTYN